MENPRTQNLGKRFHRSLVRVRVWCGFDLAPRGLETAERSRKLWKRALACFAPNSEGGGAPGGVAGRVFAGNLGGGGANIFSPPSITVNSVQTRCIVKGETQKSPLFWRFSGVQIFSGSLVL